MGLSSAFRGQKEIAQARTAAIRFFMDKTIGWELYRSLLAVLEEGSLSGAARALGLTQPTVGRHVALLEAALGTTLFTRSQAGLLPTEAALTLRDGAEAMHNMAASLERSARSLGEGVRGRVYRFASRRRIPIACGHGIHDPIAHPRRQRPHGPGPAAAGRRQRRPARRSRCHSRRPCPRRRARPAYRNRAPRDRSIHQQDLHAGASEIGTRASGSRSGRVRPPCPIGCQCTSSSRPSWCSTRAERLSTQSPSLA